MNSSNRIVVQFDPTPRPVSSYAELWGRDPKTLNAWCVKGWIPGAYKHPSGEWWVRPLDLLEFDPSSVEEKRPKLTLKTKPTSRPVERLQYPGGG